MKRSLLLFLHIFTFLFLLCIPMPPNRYFSSPGFLLKPFLERILMKLFSENMPIYSDSEGMFWVCILLIVFSLFFSILICKFFPSALEKSWFKKKKLFIYTLFFFLLNYGLSKVFKWQFYMPEPNTLYTPLGNLNKDIAYWSIIGSSYSFNLVIGLLECLGAVGLLFQKTRTLAIFLNLVILSHILLINFSFGIHVKILTTLLLILNITVGWPSLVSFFRWTLKYNNIKQISNSKRSILPKIFASIILIVICFDITYPYIKSQNFNDDLVPRHKWHGAYENKDQNHPWSKIFFHRRGYFIIHKSPQMDDFNSLSYPFKATNQNNVLLVNKNGSWIPIKLKKKNSLLMVDFEGKTMKFNQLKYRKLPILIPNEL